MRTAVLMTISVLVLGGCDAVQNPFAKQTAKPPAPAPAPAQAAAAPTPAAPPEAPSADLNAIPATAQAAAPPAPAQFVHWSPADYARREQRLDALIANAETRDGSGETQHVAEEGRYRRAHCTTKACIETVYANEEAWLRQWEGSAEVR